MTLVRGDIAIQVPIENDFAGPVSAKEKVASLADMFALPFKYEGMTTDVAYDPADPENTGKKYRLKAVALCDLGLGAWGTVLAHWAPLGEGNSQDAVSKSAGGIQTILSQLVSAGFITSNDTVRQGGNNRMYRYIEQLAEYFLHKYIFGGTLQDKMQFIHSENFSSEPNHKVLIELGRESIEFKVPVTLNGQNLASPSFANLQGTPDENAALEARFNAESEARDQLEQKLDSVTRNNTNDLPEGANNLYFTPERAAAAINSEAFQKNTAFNRNFGGGEEEVARGNHHHDERYSPAVHNHDERYYSKTDVDNKITALVTNLDWQGAVENVSDLATTYPNPNPGWTVTVNSTGDDWRFTGAAWVNIGKNTLPFASATTDGKMSKEHWAKLENLFDTLITWTKKHVFNVGVTLGWLNPPAAGETKVLAINSNREIVPASYNTVLGQRSDLPASEQAVYNAIRGIFKDSIDFTDLNNEFTAYYNMRMQYEYVLALGEVTTYSFQLRVGNNYSVSYPTVAGLNNAIQALSNAEVTAGYGVKKTVSGAEGWKSGGLLWECKSI